MGIKSIGILTSGGDSPGMNCAIRAVARTAIGKNISVFGVLRGYQGLIDNRFRQLDRSSVGNILQTGGTILQTSQKRRIQNERSRKKAFDNMKAKAIDALIVLGGNGSFKAPIYSRTSLMFLLLEFPLQLIMIFLVLIILLALTQQYSPQLKQLTG